MNVHKIRPNVWAVIPKTTIISQGGCNVGLIHTQEGVIVIDTSISTKRMQVILDITGTRAENVCLVIYTHLHADHINGNRLFNCPVICHRKASPRMSKKSANPGQSLELFADQHEKQVGDVQLRLIHTGGHTPESIVVWLPEENILFAGDLIFSGRAPFLASQTNYPALVSALQWLPSLGAEIFVPGHGPVCDEGEIHNQVNYLKTTWDMVKRHVDKQHSLKIVLADPSMPQAEGKNLSRNIEWIFQRLTKEKR